MAFSFKALLALALVAVAAARSCRNPNTCNYRGECSTPETGIGFECFCAAGYAGKRCEIAETYQDWQKMSSDGVYEYMYVHSPRLNYNQAQRACELHGGSLAIIENEAQDEHIASLSPKSSQGRYIGLKRKGKKMPAAEIFKWENGDKLEFTSYQNWFPGHPGVDQKAVCVIQDTRDMTVGWAVDGCNEARHYVCQRVAEGAEAANRRRRRRRRRRRNN
jgi:hypothetical protein